MNKNINIKIENKFAKEFKYYPEITGYLIEHIKRVMQDCYNLGIADGIAEYATNMMNDDYVDNN